MENKLKGNRYFYCDGCENYTMFVRENIWWLEGLSVGCSACYNPKMKEVSKKEYDSQERVKN